MGTNGETPESRLDRIYRLVCEENGRPSLLTRTQSLEDTVERIETTQNAHMAAIHRFNSRLDQWDGAKAEREKNEKREERKGRKNDRLIAALGVVLTFGMLLLAYKDSERSQTVDTLVKTIQQQTQSLEDLKTVTTNQHKKEDGSELVRHR